MSENTLQRIKQYLDYKDIRVSAFEREIGMSNGSFASQLKKNKTIGLDKFENILRRYSDINLEWLLKGTGHMINLDAFRDEPVIYYKTEKLDKDEAVNYKDLAEARKETIESLQKVIQYLEAQIAEGEQR
ncbi:hypothetical protein ACHRVK_16880 [Flavobacterium plurextorum]|uniref:XRE family transcriptional regulator n=1 Tax=Flavobacterium plurextorum TaxID=1114867 RepID=A0ABX4CU72_9FLAO|nr:MULTISPECIES: hypothetical protein [Flavobacterium]OXB07194.1 hypothetical protein B0A81_12045 [Flavobacterium plurextorum]UUW10910.1 hypothetical protein NLG42_08855 [Flavobacterium plurextorum]